MPLAVERIDGSLWVVEYKSPLSEQCEMVARFPNEETALHYIRAVEAEARRVNA